MIVYCANNRIILQWAVKAPSIVDLGYQADICHGQAIAKAIAPIAVKCFQVSFQGAKAPAQSSGDTNAVSAAYLSLLWLRETASLGDYLMDESPWRSDKP